MIFLKLYIYIFFQIWRLRVDLKIRFKSIVQICIESQVMEEIKTRSPKASIQGYMLYVFSKYSMFYLTNSFDVESCEPS